jgi:hypothetical protein
MKRTALMIRCVPRFGYDHTEVRAIDLDVTRDTHETELREAVQFYFAARGISDAVYDVGVDDYGFFAVINDEAYEMEWGKPLL